MTIAHRDENKLTSATHAEPLAVAALKNEAHEELPIASHRCAREAARSRCGIVIFVYALLLKVTFESVCIRFTVQRCAQADRTLVVLLAGVFFLGYL